MKVAFISEHPNKISSFSGIPYYMSKAIQEQSKSFEYIQCPPYNEKDILRNRIRGRKQLQVIGSYVSERLSNLNFDIIICQGTSMIPFIETDKPIILWHDSTWHSLTQDDFKTFRAKHALLYEWDQLVLQKCQLIVFAAEWVREDTIEHYNIPIEKLYVMPFGVNLTTISSQEALDYISKRSHTNCKLTFLGIDWARKGLPFACEVMAKLNARGLPVELDVIGCDVPRKINPIQYLKRYKNFHSYQGLQNFVKKFHSDGHVNKLGFLDKNNPSSLSKLNAILQNTHFLLHPAQYEAFGIALAEANAFGVPVISTNAYGPQTIVRNGVNGHLFDHSEYVERAIEFIIDKMKSYESYNTLALSSYQEYRNRFTWSGNYEKIKNLISSSGVFSN